MQRLVPVVLAALLVLAGCGQVPGGQSPSAETHAGGGPTAATSPATDAPDGTTTASGGAETPTATPEGRETPPPDPATDVLGWENGVWYNESLSVTRADGLNESELRAVVDRAMARVEVVRGLEFRRTVPVELITREEFRNRSGSWTAGGARRRQQNVKWEAAMMINESTDAAAVHRSNVGSGVQGYYSPAQDRIVIVSDNASTPQMDEITLSQELFHALQERRFDVSAYNTSTMELRNARNGIVEGDGNFVDYRYQQRCEAEWDCLMPRNRSGGGGGGDVHIGLYQVKYQPYSDGVAFVRARYEEGGWEAVNAVYDDPPASTEQTIHPERYPTDRPANVTVADRSSDRWHVLSVPGRPNYVSFGEAGLFVTLWYPSYVATQHSSYARTVVVPMRAHLNYTDDGTLAPLDPFNYDHPVTAGWDGDRLVPYVTNESAATNETGYVWKTRWDSATDASQFRDGYVKLLRYHGAERVGADGPGTVFRIPDGTDDGFDDAYRVTSRGDTVVVTNAPTVSGLDAVRAPR
ncbi:MAG: Hvo_1808 family surface protein [Haloferacaceae archaeon]